MARIKPVSHDDRLTLVEHLDELRTRIVICVFTFLVGFGLCFWQDEEVFDILNKPLPEGFKPLTFGVTEPFLTTVTISAYAGLALALPVILYQLYAFVLPAFSPTERKVAVPLLMLIPVLFIAGVVFCYFVVLTPALQFLLDFNADEFNTQVRARDYYSFVTLVMIAMGLGFQIPVGVLAATRLGVVTPAKLRANRRYAIVAIAVAAAFLPTIDPVTLILEMIPLILLYELSILLAAAFGSPPAEVSERTPAPEGSS
jgi:sec-independent protein translocase protein TatC